MATRRIPRVLDAPNTLITRPRANNRAPDAIINISLDRELGISGNDEISSMELLFSSAVCALLLNFHLEFVKTLRVKVEVK